VLELKQQPDLTPLRDYGINTWAQALLAWVISDRRVSSAIPTTSRPERIQENAQAADAANLPQSFRGYIQREAERCL
jgi:diketogulonate reductase-like aldo/keto reductase